MRAAFLCAFLCTNAFAYRMAVSGNSIAAGVFASSDGGKSFVEKIVERSRYNFGDGDLVNSHCSRLNQQFGNFECKNFAISGSKLGDILNEQVDPIVDYDPDYIVLEGGANDLCATNPVTPAVFFNTMADIAFKLNRNGRAVVVLGLINVNELLRHANKRGVLGIKAKTLWKLFGHCDPILIKRQDRTQLFKDYNSALEEISRVYGFYFAKQVSELKLDPSLLSKFDMFHPSRKAQELLGALSYPLGGNND